MSFLGLSRSSNPDPTISGTSYLLTLHKYLSLNLSRLAPPTSSQSASDASWLQQSYTILTLGLDPNSVPLNRNLKVPLTLGFGTPSQPTLRLTKPFLLRLPPDRLLYLLLRWQSCREPLPHVGRTDEPIAPGVPVAARGARVDTRGKSGQGDVRSVRSWVGSMRSVSVGSKSGMSWWRREEEVDEDKILLALYSVFTVLPALLIHPPFLSDRPIAELVDAGGYTQLGGIDVRVPLDVLRNLQILELESYDPRGLLIPPNPALRGLTVRDVQDADEWLEELLLLVPEATPSNLTPNPIESPQPVFPESYPPRFPNLRHLSLHSTSLLTFPLIPLNRLVYLDLSHNLLNALPSSLSSLSALQSLNLSNNLIVSVRNAPQALGNITSLNLSHNRLDCLVGLERVLGLERVDVRYNAIPTWDEVGRLSVLPHLKEVWCEDNPFSVVTTETEEWRVELGVSLYREGRGEVMLDDKPLTWNESRRIESLLQTRGFARRTNEPHYVPQAGPSRTSTSLGQTVVAATSNDRVASPDPPARVVSPVLGRGVQKKRRSRRVINLDSGNGADFKPSDEMDVQAALKGSKSPASGEDEPVEQVETVRVKHGQRGKVHGLFAGTG